MKLETFFEKFDLFADAPDAVAKMRELVLDLAVQGKVADQGVSDEPAAELLQRLIAFKLANPLSGRSGRSMDGPVEVEANSNSLPTNWVNTTIGEVLYVIRGASPRPKGDPQYFSEARTPYHWVKISDIRKHGQDGLLMDTDEFLTEAGMRKSVLLPKGTLVLTNSATIGVPIVLGIEGCCIHDGYLAFPNFPHELLSQKFLLYLFHTLKKHAERSARGLAQLNLNTDLVRSFPFGLPPLAEQKRIVAKVDELMALCDALEAQQQERETRHAALARASLARFADAPTSANLNFIFHTSYDIPPAELRKSILTLAVQGKLVAQDPSDEPAAKLLETIAKQRAKLFDSDSLRKTKPCRQFTSDEAPNEIPATWAWTMLGEVTDIGTGSTPSRTEASFWIDGTIPWITSGSTSRSPITEGDELVTPAAVKAHRLRVYPPGTLLVALYGQGKTRGQVAALEIPATINQACAAICPLNGIPPMQAYLNLLLQKQYDEMRSLSAGGAQPNLNVQKVKEVFVPLPPLAEQRRIVSKVDQLMALVDELETQLAASGTTAANLLEAVVTELTTQESPYRATSCEGRGGVHDARQTDQAIKQIDEASLAQSEAVVFDETAPPIWEQLAEIGREAPAGTWETVPDDLSMRIDEIVYGKGESDR